MDTRIQKTKIAYEVVADLFRTDFEGQQFPEEAIHEFTTLIKDRKLGMNRIADLGSGAGTLIDHLLPAGIRCVDAVDITESFVEYLRNKYAEVSGIRVFHEDMIDYLSQVPDESLGAVAATFSITHIPEEFINPLFSHMYRALVPGGIMLIACHTGEHKGMINEPYQQKKDPRMNHPESLSIYMNYFTHEELTASIRHAGFVVTSSLEVDGSEKHGYVSEDQLWMLAEKKAIRAH
jgi:SAM-dependent methyltransferase